MMRKTLAAGLVAVLLAVMLNGCGSSDNQTAATESSSVGSVDVQQAEPAGEQEASADSLSSSKKNEEQSRDDTTFSQVLVDNDSLKFEITGIGSDDIWGYTWDVSIENKTDKLVMVSMDGVSVNGTMCDSFWATEIEAGKKSNEQISWSTDTLKENGVNTVTQVEFDLQMYDAEDLMTEYHKDHYVVYPQGEEAAENVGREAAESDQVLFDKDEASMTVTGFEPNGEWGYTVKVYLENKTDKTLMFSVENASLNGVMCDPLWATEVEGGKTSNSEIYWAKDQLEENGISDIKEIELPITVYPSDDWAESSVIVDEKYTLKP